MIKAAILTAALAIPTVASATTTVYNFNGLTAGTVPPANTADSGVKYLGTTTIGQIDTTGDNWVFNAGTSGFNQIVRNDVHPGMSGNWISSYPSAASGTTAPINYDTQASRVNSGGGTFGLSSAGSFTVSFIASLNPLQYTNSSGTLTTVNSRAIAAIGIDQSTGGTSPVNGVPDGKLRGFGGTNENAEWGPYFGYDTAGTGSWVLRAAGLGSTASVGVGSLSGAWLVQLTVDTTTNANGVGTLQVQQLFDASGATVVDSLHTVGAATTGISLNLGTMSTASAGGTSAGPNPANWNGFMVRTTNNGGIDNFTVNSIVPEPTTFALIGLGGVSTLLRRRRSA